MEWWLLGVGGKGNMELIFNGYRILVLQDERVLGVGDGGGWATE